MSKQEVKLILEDTGKNRILYVRKDDGTEYMVTVFDGGGYYSDIWLRTTEEIVASNKEREEAEVLRMAEIQARQHSRKVNNLAKLIMFMQRRKK